MPVTSKVQWRKFAQMMKDGKITKATFDEWVAGVDFDKLPERIGAKPKASPKARRTAPSPRSPRRTRVKKRKRF